MIIQSEGSINDIMLRQATKENEYVYHFKKSLILNMIPSLMSKATFAEEKSFNFSTRIRATLHVISREERARIISFLEHIEGELPRELAEERLGLIELIKNL